MKRCFSIISIVLFVAFVFCVISVPVQAQEKTMKLRISSMWPAQHPLTKAFDQWGKDIEKVTSGRVTFTVFAASTLSPPMQVYDNTVKGVVDVGTSLLAYSPGRLPLSEVLQQPLGYRNGYQSTKLADAYYKKFKPKEFDDVKVMFLHGAAPGFIFTKNSVKSTADVKGLRIKANAENVDIVKNLGASPVTMPVTETYDSLSRGVIDGALFPIEALQGFKIGEVVKTVIENYGVSYMTSMYVIMNKDKWNAMPPDIQKIVSEVALETKEKQGALWNEMDLEGVDSFKNAGGQIIPLSEAEASRWIKAVEPVIGNYKKNMVAKGFKEADVDGWVKYIKERTEYWKKEEKQRKIPAPFE